MWAEIWSSMSKSSWQNSPTDFVNCLSELHNVSLTLSWFFLLNFYNSVLDLQFVVVV